MEKTPEQTVADALKVINSAADSAASKLVIAADSAATAAAHRLAEAADSAIKVVATATLEAQKVSSTRNSEDHDLLIKLGERMDQLRLAINELRTGNGATIKDHEQRLACLEKAQATEGGKAGGRKDLWGWIIGAIMTLIAIASFILPRLK